VSPVRYKLGFYIPEDDILHSHCRENLNSYIAFPKLQTVTTLTILAAASSVRQTAMRELGYTGKLVLLGGHEAMRELGDTGKLVLLGGHE
jgi:hypothetical protein